jgi:hypothetical protein
VDINLDDPKNPYKFNDVILGPMSDQLKQNIRSINAHIELTLLVHLKVGVTKWRRVKMMKRQLNLHFKCKNKKCGKDWWTEFGLAIVYCVNYQHKKGLEQ